MYHCVPLYPHENLLVRIIQFFFLVEYVFNVASDKYFLITQLYIIYSTVLYTQFPLCIYIYVYLVIYTVQYYTDSLTIVSDHQICLQHLQLIRNVAVADSSFAAHLLEIDVTGEQRLAGDSTCYWRVFRLEHLKIIYRNIEVSYGFLWFP